MIIIVQIIDTDGDIGWENICDEADKMADQYECVVQAISQNGKKKNFGRKPKWELLEGVDLSGKKFDEFTIDEINKMSYDKYWRERAKQCMRDHPDIYEYWNGEEYIKLHIRYKLAPNPRMKNSCWLSCFMATRKEQFLRGIFLFWYEIPSEIMTKLNSIEPKDLGKPDRWFETEYCIECDDF